MAALRSSHLRVPTNDARARAALLMWLGRALADDEYLESVMRRLPVELEPDLLDYVICDIAATRAYKRGWNRGVDDADAVRANGRRAHPTDAKVQRRRANKRARVSRKASR